jgi:trehalose-phosphatase
MHVVRAEAEPRLSSFFATLPLARLSLLLLDYDGTLAPFTVERDLAAPYPGVCEALNRIVGTGHTRLVMVTGRAARSLPPLLGLDRPVEVWGSHGAERLRADGTYTPAFTPADARSGLSEAWNWLAQAGYAPQGERKPTALALHWRGLADDEAAALRARAEQAWSAIARRCGLLLRPFDGGVELRAAGFDKGRPVRTLLAEAGPGAAAAFLGDDLTDEHAFAAMRGHGLTALVRPEPRPTVAELWLRPPEELLAFLHRWHQAASEHARAYGN